MFRILLEHHQGVQ